MNRNEKHNSELFLRPRFTIDCDRTPSEVKASVLKNLQNIKTDFKTKISDNHFFIDVPTKDAHFWSPQLHFRIEDDYNGKTQIIGLFGPKSQVWTLFMFIHFIVATAFIGFAILFYVNNKFDRSVIFPVIMLILLPIIWFLLYFIGSIGKEKGKPQMDELKSFMKLVLEDV